MKESLFREKALSAALPGITRSLLLLIWINTSKVKPRDDSSVLKQLTSAIRQDQPWPEQYLALTVFASSSTAAKVFVRRHRRKRSRTYTIDQPSD